MHGPDFSNELGYQLFKAAADYAFNAITITTASDDGGPGVIVYVNEAFTEMTGYTAEEVLGQNPGVLQGPNTEQEVLQRLGEQIRRGEIFHGETVNYRKDGSEFILEWQVIPVKTEGKTTHHVAIQHDISGVI